LRLNLSFFCRSRILFCSSRDAPPRCLSPLGHNQHFFKKIIIYIFGACQRVPKSPQSTQLATRTRHSAAHFGANAQSMSQNCQNLLSRPPGPGPRVGKVQVRRQSAQQATRKYARTARIVAKGSANLLLVKYMLSRTARRAYGSIASRCHSRRAESTHSRKLAQPREP
jgi:hypothetical protein